MLVDPEIMIFTVGNENISNLFKININQPPEGVSPKEWINVLCDLITESFFASYGVHKVLLETLDEAFRDFGVYSGSGNYPTWNEIKWRLESKAEKAKGRYGAWMESAMRIAHVLTFGNFGRALNYKGKESINVKDILNKKVIFELNALGTIEKKFFCEFILTYIYKLKKARQNHVTSFDHAIIVDEAHNIFLKDKTHFVKESVTDMIYREMREYGTALICLDQHISKLSDTVAGNSACHVAFQQQLPQDIDEISGLMQLKDRKQYFTMLPVGTAIVKLAERYNKPFLVQVENVKLREKDVSDINVKNRMNAIFTGKNLPEKDPEFMKELTEPETIEPEPVEVQEAEKTIEPTETLQDIIVGPAVEPEVKVEPTIEAEQPKVETEIKTEVEEKQESNLPLTKVQQVLYEYVDKKIAFGTELKEIEHILEQYTQEGNYTIEDVSAVINYALKSLFKENGNSESVTTQEREKQKVYKPEKSINSTHITEGKINPKISSKTNLKLSGLDENQERFLTFLKQNPDHNFSTVEIYKQLKLSARKGNKIKNDLLEAGKIKIIEKKNHKGWKKLIRLTF